MHVEAVRAVEGGGGHGHERAAHGCGPATPAPEAGEASGDRRADGRPWHVLSAERGGVALNEEFLRRCAWEIGARRAHETYVCPDSYVAFSVVSPGQGFVVWRVQQGWIDELARRKGGAWNGARFVVRLYDVSCIIFNGLNAHRMRDVAIAGLAGERLVELPLAGTTQIAEVGFLLRSNEFVAAARSPAVHFPATGPSAHSDLAALYVDDRLVPEPVASPWEGASYLRERGKPRLRPDLRIAFLSFEAEAAGHHGTVGKFVSALATELRAQGQDVHAFVPAGGDFRERREVAGVSYHPVPIERVNGPVSAALSFARSLEAQLERLPAFDLFHMQEWMTALVPWVGTRPTALALSSIERTRRNGTAPSSLSLEIEKLEREVAHAAECIIVPAWLRDKALSSLGTDERRVHPFPVEGRPLDEWEMPLDRGAVKHGIGVGPLDRMLIFVGPLEPGAGPDLIVEALPTVLSRTPNARMVFVGCGGLHDHLAGRAHQLGVGHAVRLLGHVEGPQLARLLRASEALLLPSRHRVAHDEQAVSLARRAELPVMTTHGGPVHLVKHEDNGVVVYDNPPSLVWGMSRLLQDPGHAQRMGRNGARSAEGTSWAGVARHYADLCAQSFAELSERAGETGPARSATT